MKNSNSKKMPKFNMDDWEVVKNTPSNSAPKKFNMNEWEVGSPQTISSEGFLQKLPRNLEIGLFNQRQNAVNLPHDLVSSLEQQGNALGQIGNKYFPIEKYAGNNRLPFSGNNKPYKNISEYLPNEQYDFAKMFGQQGAPTFSDTLIQKGVEHAPEIIGGMNALRNVLPYLTRRGASKNLRLAQNKINELSDLDRNQILDLYHGTGEGIGNKISELGLNASKYSPNYPTLTNRLETAAEYSQRRHNNDEIGDILKISLPKYEASKYLHPENTEWFLPRLRGHEESQLFGIKEPIPSKYISKVGENDISGNPMNISELLNRKQVNISPEIIDDLAQFLPKTTPYRKAIEAAKKGDYKDLFNLQSDVGKHAADYAKSLFSAADRAHGREGLAARQRLLDAIHEDLQAKGHHDISKLLKKGQDEYRRYSKFKPYRNALGLAAAAYAVPKNALTNLVQKVIHLNNQ